ncbi:Na+/H+ antiporter subunit E [Nonomuraea sp. C10]|uniref:Na+/H+ antiporter subunit E n=1 Tax=Nonomuraea sp. C10 TaxID=2600577 RepID=UPI0011CE1A22|nr:Na+/H+ antiporter subunit E [Nonomuraea sp. C10]TXK41345.1 Na+/H+ antiporter subunit E [Nonomuraea sp. C10]
MTEPSEAGPQEPERQGKTRDRLAPRLFGRPVPLALVCWLALIWMMLWGDLSFGTLVGGLIAGAVVTWLLPLPVLDPGIRFRPLPFVRFLAWFLLDLVTSTARVVFWVLRSPSPPTAIVPVRLRTSSEAMTVIIMIGVTTVPGSLVLGADRERRELTIHVLGRSGPHAVVAALTQDEVTALETRIVAAFGTRADRKELG